MKFLFGLTRTSLSLQQAQWVLLLGLILLLLFLSRLEAWDFLRP